LTLTKSGNGKEYTTINSIIPEDPFPLHADAKVANSWVNDELTWSDVYAKKPEEYLEMVAKGETPTWDSETKKWISGAKGEDTIVGNKKPATTIEDPQENEEADDNLPF